MAKINTTEFAKTCKMCGCDFIGSGPAAVYCTSCKEVVLGRQREASRIRVAKVRAATGRIKKPGVGSGNNQKLGTEHPSYKHGYYIADRLRVTKKLTQRYCERCEKDLIDVNRWMWVVHHKDHNHCNNAEENLELLCKRCHQIEHECHTAFSKGATTISKESRDKCPEKHGTLQGDDIVCSAQECAAAKAGKA